MRVGISTVRYNSRDIPCFLLVQRTSSACKLTSYSTTLFVAMKTLDVTDNCMRDQICADSSRNTGCVSLVPDLSRRRVRFSLSCSVPVVVLYGNRARRCEREARLR